jgi:hypothetical protein
LKNNVDLLNRDQLAAAWLERASLADLASFDEGDVPEQVRVLIPYAEIWGIEDDFQRERITRKTPPDLCDHVIHVLRMHGDALDAWLAGEESWSERPSDAYVAFSVMRIAGDLMSVIQRTERR